MTSNPTIFEKALNGSVAYDGQIQDLAIRGVAVEEAARLLTSYDIRWACDVLRGVHDRTGGLDGRVSIEVDPRVADDTAKTVAEARALWWLVARPNVMIKIPATQAGLAAITAATAEGISVNVTLIFSLDRYDQVMDAYLTGLERAHEAGVDLSAIRSVASFFVSRVDVEVDTRLAKIGTEKARSLRGQAGVANARLAYRRFEAVLGSERWRRLEAVGAHPQRPLWASTGVKNPEYPDVLYVTSLIAPNVVSTMPEPTLDAVADHGQISPDTVTGMYDQAEQVMAGLAEVGVEYDEVVQLLEREGVRKFTDAWTLLLRRLEESLAAAAARRTAGSRLRASCENDQ
ncbi:transaldolase [Actinoallomurus oryzae]|uniref:Transaldolase n=1 Tax=Actinoallomurus oryzae TaxID=502180 RepID=A0ABP8PPD3_9ACTN